MAEEFFSKTYYDEIDDERHWIDTHQYQCMAIEKFFAKLLFKDDMSKIIYSTPDISFRRRTELMDAEKIEAPETAYNPISLGLPYMSYYHSGDIEPDDRTAAMQAGQAVVGQYITEANQSLRSTAYQTEYECTIFFSRRDEVRLAQQLLYWEMEPKHPVFLVGKVRWRNTILEIPCFMTIESVDTNVQYKESDWLTQSRIFPVKIKVKMRSYQVLVNSIDHMYTLPIRFGNKHSPGTKEACEDIYLVEESVLVWANDKFGFESTITEEVLENEDVKTIVDNYFAEERYTKEELEDLIGLIPNYTTNDIIKGYFIGDPEISFKLLEVVKELSTDKSLTIRYNVSPETSPVFQSFKVLVPGRDEIMIDSLEKDLLTIEGLHANSEYKIKILASSTSGIETLFTLTGTTIDSEENFAPQPEKINRKPGNSLIGMEF